MLTWNESASDPWTNFATMNDINIFFVYMNTLIGLMVIFFAQEKPSFDFFWYSMLQQYLGDPFENIILVIMVPPYVDGIFKQYIIIFSGSPLVYNTFTTCMEFHVPLLQRVCRKLSSEKFINSTVHLLLRLNPLIKLMWFFDISFISVWVIL